MQIVYFPYIPIKENSYVDFGNGLIVWHFYSLAEKYIPDKVTRDHVTKLIDANIQGETKEKIKGISVVSIGKTDFRVFNPQEEKLIQEAKLSLFLSKIAKTNTTILGSGGDGWSLSTSENFEPVYQNFELGNDYLSERAGYIVNIGSMGYKIGEKKFYKPSHVIISLFGMSIDTELFSKLIEIRDKNGKILFRRIIRATDLLFQAYYNTPSVSKNARILLIAAAFETLLDLNEPAKKYFKDALEGYCDFEGEKKYRCYYQNHGKSVRERNRSIKVLWGESFFNLRNQIIHGDVVLEDQYQFHNGDRQIDIAILFFSFLVKQLINKKYREPKPFWDKIEWKQREDETEGFHYEDHSVAVLIARKFRQASKKAKI